MWQCTNIPALTHVTRQGWTLEPGKRLGAFWERSKGILGVCPPVFNYKSPQNPSIFPGSSVRPGILIRRQIKNRNQKYRELTFSGKHFGNINNRKQKIGVGNITALDVWTNWKSEQTWNTWKTHTLTNVLDTYRKMPQKKNVSGLEKNKSDTLSMIEIPDNADNSDK